MTTKAKPHNAIEPLEEAAHDLVENAGAYAKHQLQAGLKVADTFKVEVSDRIKERPLTTVAIAFGVGYIVGKICGIGR